jgi:O-antigen/teichoic acid export membrane protein
LASGASEGAPPPLTPATGQDDGGAASSTQRQPSFWRQAASYSTASFIFQATYLVQNVVVARLLGPALVGLWDALSLVNLYNVTHLGVLQAVYREVPIVRGRGDAALVARLRNQALVAAIVPSTVLSLAVLGYAGLTWRADVPELRMGLVGLAVLVVAQQVHSLFQVLLRGDNRFGLLSVNQLVLSGAAIIHAGLVAWLGFTGQVLGAIAVQIVGALCIMVVGGYRLRFRLEPRLYASLVRIGLPLGMMVFSEAVFTGADRLVILTFLDATDLGYYRIVGLCSGFLIFLPGVLGQMTYPRMGEQYGATDDLRALRRIFLQPTLAIATGLPLLVGGLYLMLPSLVGIFLPAFTPGVGPARWVIFGLAIMPMFGMASYILMVGDRAIQVILGQLAGAAVKGLLGGGAALLGYGLEGVARGVALGYVVYGALIFVCGARLLDWSWREQATVATRLVLPTLVALAMMVSLDHVVAALSPGAPLLAQGLVGAAVFGVAYSALATAWLRKTSPDAWAVVATWRRGRH